MTDVTRQARLLAALRSAVTERYRSGSNARDPGERARLLHRHRECRTLWRMGEPATEARDLARRLDVALQLGVGDDPAALEALALDLTGLLVELYAEFLAVGSPLRPG